MCRFTVSFTAQWEHRDEVDEENREPAGLDEAHVDAALPAGTG